MAIFDAKFELLDDGTLYDDGDTDYNAGTAKEIDWTQANLEMGAGTPLYLNIRVGTTAYAGGTTADFKLFADDTSSGHDSSSTVVMATGPIALANIDAAGDWIYRGVLPVNVDAERYLQLGVTCVGTFTAGSVDCWIDHGPQSSYDTQVTTSNI